MVGIVWGSARRGAPRVPAEAGVPSRTRALGWAALRGCGPAGRVPAEAGVPSRWRDHDGWRTPPDCIPRQPSAKHFATSPIVTTRWLRAPPPYDSHHARSPPPRLRRPAPPRRLRPGPSGAGHPAAAPLPGHCRPGRPGRLPRPGGSDFPRRQLARHPGTRADPLRPGRGRRRPAGRSRDGLHPLPHLAAGQPPGAGARERLRPEPPGMVDLRPRRREPDSALARPSGGRHASDRRPCRTELVRGRLGHRRSDPGGRRLDAVGHRCRRRQRRAAGQRRAPVLSRLVARRADRLPRPHR